MKNNRFKIAHYKAMVSDLGAANFQKFIALKLLNIVGA